MRPSAHANRRKAHVLSTAVAVVAVAAAAIVAGGSRQTQPQPITKGPFAPTVESLTTYRSPEWFRDAKFGIWAHWGPQSVPMAGDWYARRMYEQGHRQYQHHLDNYGHPSQQGYKDIIPLWKAEKWDPDRLMALYKKAGARYFVSMGVHHDNFDLWNSTHHRWNAVKMGPMRDVVGNWQRAAQKYGLRFGVSEHLGASFTWWQSSHGADKTGPKAGVPYDGANPEFQDLYHPAAAPGDTAWYSTNPAWHREWFDRIKDLVDQYHPDLLYTDGGLPFGETGRSLVAHFYNTNLVRNGGRLEAVYTCKPIGSGEFAPGECVQDMERGVLSGVNPLPWQTDTSIGDWFYNRGWKFRPVSWVIHMLVDIVSKNGNLLLNVVQRPDGSLDPEVERMLGDLAAWTTTNGDAIYGTRPWVIHGEGPAKADGGHFKEDVVYTSQDVRFTTKGQALYAIVMGWPEKTVTIRSLGTNSPHLGGRVREVTLLGHEGKVAWTQDEHALTIAVPDTRPGEHAFAFRVLGVIR
jgi:alpha-L-fucosidase